MMIFKVSTQSRPVEHRAMISPFLQAQGQLFFPVSPTQPDSLLLLLVCLSLNKEFSSSGLGPLVSA
jgi:hypothetical protein